MSPPVVPELSKPEIVAGRPDCPFVILCDHASNALPSEFGTLGLPPEQLERHIGYDIGARAMTLSLAGRLGATALLTRFSRLLIDPNRGEDDPTLVMRLSDGAVVPGNARVGPDEIARRIATWHRPYHQAITHVLDEMLARGLVPIIVSLHTFTPVWRGKPRPWHAGILWDTDDRLSRPLIEGLAADPSLTVGDNEPYDGALRGDTMWQHGTMRGLPHAIVEVRQDLAADAAGAESWAARLASLLGPLAARPDLSQVMYLGSRLDSGTEY
jgi:predicted N-formylglutamate amidohydrolase